MKSLRSLQIAAALPLLILGLLAQGCATPAKVYQTPDDAVTALVGAVRAHSKPQVLAVLGSDAEQVIYSGDGVADKNAGENFLRAYDERHRLDSAEDGSKTLVIGNSDWPLPIPLRNDSAKGGWYFDVPAGKEEILNRRIGANELDVIQVCGAFVDAQREYAMADRDGDGVLEYATRAMSEPGKRNGLYWETDPSEPPSPLGPLVVDAIDEGYSAVARRKPRPFHGYYFRFLTANGPNARGGSLNYMVGNDLIGGFALIAYPAEYGNSGIMTFIVNHEGIVYQKDLGEDTAKIAQEVKAFDPDPAWQKVADVMTATPS